MTTFQITLKDRSTEEISGADAYQQEGQMTTFFRTASGRDVLDTWATRIASFRTSEVVIIRRMEPAATAIAPGDVPRSPMALRSA